MKATNKIDVHHHLFPKEYVDALKEAGIENSLGKAFPEWTPETSIKQMDSNGIKIAILSITAPGVYFPGKEFPEGFSENLARIGNEAIANTIKKYPNRFGGFATIPLLNTERAIEELNYAFDTLKFNGVCLMTNYKGTYLGDERFEPFFRELDKRKAVVFVHPTDPEGQLDPKTGMPNALIEVTFDTTRAAANLMYNGVTDRYKHIRYILAHGGGTIPYIAWRLSLIEYEQKGKTPPVIRTLYDLLIKGRPEKGLRHLKNMYYDTANVSGEYALKTLKSFAGSGNILFGTDLCISKLASIVSKNLSKEGDFSREEFDKLAYHNGLGLFPELEQIYNQ